MRVLKQAEFGCFKKGRLHLDDVKDNLKIEAMRSFASYDSTVEEIDEKAMEERMKFLDQSDGIKRICPHCKRDDFKSQSGFTRHLIQCKEDSGELSGNAGHDDGAGSGAKDRQPQTSVGKTGPK
jgi:hypothetical protein